MEGYPKSQARVFVASSTKSLPVAEALKHALSTDDLVVVPWKELGVFSLSEHTIQSLENAANTCQFAAFVLGQDDITRHGDREYYVPRDNVVFELGLFLGRIGRRRSFMLKPKGIDIRLPSDLSGVTWAEFVAMGSDAVDLSLACAQIRQAMRSAPPTIADSILYRVFFPPIIIAHCRRRFARFLSSPFKFVLPRFGCDAQLTVCSRNGMIVRHSRVSSHTQDVREHDGRILWCTFHFGPQDRPFDTLVRFPDRNGWVVWTDTGYSQFHTYISSRGNQRLCMACSEWRKHSVYFLEMHHELSDPLDDYLLPQVGQLLGDRINSLGAQ